MVPWWVSSTLLLLLLLLLLFVFVGYLDFWPMIKSLVDFEKSTLRYTWNHCRLSEFLILLFTLSFPVELVCSPIILKLSPLLMLMHKNTILFLRFEVLSIVSPQKLAYSLSQVFCKIKRKLLFIMV